MTTAAILAIVFGVLLSISEGLAQVPSIKSNSVFQLIVNILKMLTGKTPPSA